tara:strand:- start:1282 stop:1896 length:615 start_codon:yes stop_codon:yes gene_type:complete
VRKIGLLDYGMGNIHSVKKSIENLDQEVLIINQRNQIKQCEGLIIPGQGAFDPAIKNLHETGLIETIKEWINEGNPFLGICLGLQLLFEFSEEGSSEGLGIVKGGVKKIPQIKNQKIPHIGWCELLVKKESTLLDLDEPNNWVYFDHSYYAVPIDKKIISANVQYGSIFLTAIIEYENLVACQFHPEKSGKKGEIILKRWLQNI